MSEPRFTKSSLASIWRLEPDRGGGCDEPPHPLRTIAGDALLIAIVLMCIALPALFGGV